MPEKSAPKYRPTEPTTPRCSQEQVQAILNATDWKKYWEEVNWEVEGELMGCSCVMCPAYENWIRRRKEIYGPNEQERLKETLKEIEDHRANVRAGKEYDRRKVEGTGLVYKMIPA